MIRVAQLRMRVSSSVPSRKNTWKLGCLCLVSVIPWGIYASCLCSSKHWSEGKYFHQSHCKSPHTKAQLLWDLVLLFWDKQSPFGQGKGTWLSGGGRAVVLRWSVEFGTLCCVTLLSVLLAVYWYFLFQLLWNVDMRKARWPPHRISQNFWSREILPQNEGNPGWLTKKRLWL